MLVICVLAAEFIGNNAHRKQGVKIYVKTVNR